MHRVRVWHLFEYEPPDDPRYVPGRWAKHGTEFANYTREKALEDARRSTRFWAEETCRLVPGCRIAAAAYEIVA